MKKDIYKDAAMARAMRAKGRKVKSHGSCKAKRHPTSPRVNNPMYNR